MKILVTGSNGLVGSAIKEKYKNFNPHEWHFINKEMVDLRKQTEVNNLLKFLSYDKPIDAVIHCAGRVGGIGRNLEQPHLQFHDNIMINTNIINACFNFEINKMIILSSMCIFPANEPIFTEDNMHNGEPYPAHRAYAYAKRMADIQIEAYKKIRPQLDACILIPSNIYGPNDYYNLDDGHVIPSLMNKAYIAKMSNIPFKIWGNGSAIREFIYSLDVAEVCYKLATMKDKLPDRLILSGDNEKSIKEVAELIHEYMCPSQKLEWDSTKPDGQLKRPSSKDLFNKVFPNFKFTPFKESLKQSCRWLENNYSRARQ